MSHDHRGFLCWVSDHPVMAYLLLLVITGMVQFGLAWWFYSLTN